MSLLYLLVLGNKGDYMLRKCSGRRSKILIGKTSGFLEIYNLNWVLIVFRQDQRVVKRSDYVSTKNKTLKIFIQ